MLNLPEQQPPSLTRIAKRELLNRDEGLIKKYDERTNPATGYDELNITTSKKTQEWLLQALILRFERDFGSFYIGLQAR